MMFWVSQSVKSTRVVRILVAFLSGDSYPPDGSTEHGGGRHHPANLPKHSSDQMFRGESGVLHSSKRVDKTASELPMGTGRTAPDPRLRASIELTGSKFGGRLNLMAVSETLAGCWGSWITMTPVAKSAKSIKRAGRNPVMLGLWAPRSNGIAFASASISSSAAWMRTPLERVRRPRSRPNVAGRARSDGGRHDDT